DPDLPRVPGRLHRGGPRSVGELRRAVLGLHEAGAQVGRSSGSGRSGGRRGGGDPGARSGDEVAITQPDPSEAPEKSGAFFLIDEERSRDLTIRRSDPFARRPPIILPPSSPILAP